MSSSVTVLSRDNYRVRAILDSSPIPPEYQGFPDVIISSDGNITESFSNSTKTNAILNAYSHFDQDTFFRWVRIFADDLVNYKEAGIEDERNIPLRADISTHSGYSQGESWIQISFAPAHVVPDLNYVSELVYWARGDVYYLSVEKSVIWTPNDSSFEPYTEWVNTRNYLHGFYTDSPESENYVRDSALDLLHEATM